MTLPRTFHEARKQLAQGSTTVAAMAETALRKAKDTASLNCYIELFSESALAKAAQVDAKLAAGQAGPLAGAIVSIKDNLCYAGHRVTAASRMLENYISPYSATVVERLLQADAVIIGRTNCDEFAMGSSNESSHYGPVDNPHDTTRVPGGSSGGAAASVAAGTCHVAMASDTGGSIRQPASFCGVAGFKPTYGRVSRYGLIAFASSFDQIGPIAHDAEDVAAVYAVIAGPDPCDNTSSHRPAGIPAAKQKLNVGYYAHCLQHPGMDPEIRAHVEQQLEALRAQGHQVEALDLPLADLFVPTYYILSTAEASSNLARFDGIRYGHRTEQAGEMDLVYRKSRSEGFGPEVQRRVLLGTFVLSAGYYDAYYGQAMRVRRLIREKTLETLQGRDFILMPTGPTTAFRKAEIKDPVAMYLQDIFTVQANLAGVPAISIPTGHHSNGLPFGLQLMGRPFHDEQLLHWAQHLFAH